MGAVLDAADGSIVDGTLGALQALSALALIVALAWLARRLFKRGLLARRSQHIHIEDRLGLDLRQALLIVRVEQRRFLLATSEQSPARVIAELTAASVSTASPSLSPPGEHEPP